VVVRFAHELDVDAEFRQGIGQRRHRAPSHLGGCIEPVGADTGGREGGQETCCRGAVAADHLGMTHRGTGGASRDAPLAVAGSVYEVSQLAQAFGERLGVVGAQRADERGRPFGCGRDEQRPCGDGLRTRNAHFDHGKTLGEWCSSGVLGALYAGHLGRKAV